MILFANLMRLLCKCGLSELFWREYPAPAARRAARDAQLLMYVKPLRLRVPV